jgi:hypothetical protein
MLKAHMSEEVVHFPNLIWPTINNPNDVISVLQMMRIAFFYSTALLNFLNLPFENTLVILISYGMREEIKFLSSDVRETDELSRNDEKICINFKYKNHSLIIEKSYLTIIKIVIVSFHSFCVQYICFKNGFAYKKVKDDCIILAKIQTDWTALQCKICVSILFLKPTWGQVECTV